MHTDQITIPAQDRPSPVNPSGQGSHLASTVGEYMFVQLTPA